MQSVIKKNTHSITFVVDNVEMARKKLPECKTHEAIVRLIEGHTPHLARRFAGKIESCCDYSDNVVAEFGSHPLITAIHLAFSQHRPLVLSPDMIWITIAQGLIQHVENFSEKLRSAFVRHEGKKTITVVRNDFIRGTPENPWDEVFHEFSDKVRNCVVNPELYNLFLCDFSTSGKVEKIASELAFLGALKPYFKLVFVCICGFPSITLEGTVEDWMRLKAKVERIDSFGFGVGMWIRQLLVICDHFIAAADGKVDVRHWQNMYKLQKAYGKDKINGWITRLFPYLRHYETGAFSVVNPLTQNDSIYDADAEYGALSGEAIATDSLPTGLSSIPFECQGNGYECLMHFVSGFVGVTQNPKTLALRPKIGWAVCEGEIEK